MRRGVVPLLALVLGVTALAANGVAQPPGARRPPRGEEARGVLVRVGAPAWVRAGDTERTVVVVGSDAVVDGTVLDDLVVVGGDARVAGRVAGDIVMVGGRLALEPGARVGGNVRLHGDSRLAQAPGASIGGAVERRTGISFGPLAGWLLWIGVTLMLALAGLLFAAVGGRQLDESAALLLRRPGPVVVTTLVLIAAVPILAILAFITVIGIPVGIALLVALVPALGLAGYLAAAMALGDVVLRRLGRGRREAPAVRAARVERGPGREVFGPGGPVTSAPPPLPGSPGAWGGPATSGTSGEPGPAPAAVHPYREVALGVVLFQLVLLIPFLGFLLVAVAAHLGAGALAYRTWLVWRRPRPEAGPGLEAREAA